MPGRLIKRSERRVAELERLTAEDNLDEEPQAPLSASAVKLALSIVRAMELRWLTLNRVGIFALPDGGVALQTMGTRRTASIEIAANSSKPMDGKYAGRGVYHRQPISGIDAAADFLASNTV